MKRYFMVFCCLLLFHLALLVPLCKISVSVAFASEQALAEAEKLNSQLMELYDQGMYAEAASLAEQVLSIYEKALGPEHPDTVGGLLILARLYQSMGEYAKAGPLYKRNLGIIEKALGPDHPVTASSLFYLARLYKDMNEYTMAEPLYKRALAIIDMSQGSDHPDTAVILNDLAQCYNSTGSYTKAEPLFKRALAITEKSLGPEHPDTAAILNNLALCNKLNDTYAQAEPLYKRALSIREKALGPEHPDVAQSLRNLALLYAAMGSNAKAEPLFKRALAIREKAFGPEHLETAISMNDLAVCFQNIDDYAQAEPLHKRALAIHEKALGPEHPETASILIDLADLYHSTRAHDQAEAFYKRALFILENSLGPEHSETATCLNNLSMLYKELGFYEQAKHLLKRVLAIREIALGPEHPETAISLDNLALLYQFMGAYDQAEPLYKRALAIWEKFKGPEHRDTAICLNNLALLYDSMGAYDQAEPLYKRALAIREKALGPEHPDTANSLNNLAVLYRLMGDYDQAWPLYKRALAIQEKALGPEHPETANSLNNLGVFADAIGAYEVAEPLHKRALAIREKALGPEHPETANSLQNLANCYMHTGEYDKAEPLLIRALAIFLKSLGPEHPHTSIILTSLARLNKDLQRLDFATFFGKLAVNALQQARTSLYAMDKALQESFVRSYKIAYQTLADLLIELGRLTEAEQVLRMLKEEEFFEYTRNDLSGDNGDPRQTRVTYNSFENEWVQDFERIFKTLEELRQETAPLRLNKGRSQEEEQRLVQLEENEDKELRRFQDLLDAAAKAFVTMDDGTRDKLKAERFEDDVRKDLSGLQGKPVILAYLLLEDELRILLTTPQEQRAYSSKVTSFELNKKIGAWRQTLLDPDSDPRPLGQELHKLLLAPLACDLEELGVTHLSFFLDGALRYVPMAALHDGERYLVERYTLSVFTPTSRGKIKQASVDDWRVAGFGASQGGEGFVPLPGVVMELEGIVKRSTEDKGGVVPGAIHLDLAFTAASLRASLRQQYPVVHIASHFKFTPGGSDRDSYLLLGDGKHLSLADLRLDNDFDMDTVDLLVLSACETAVSANSADGREVDGLAITAQRKGACAVIATLWPVADASTAELMQRFYQLRQGQSLTKSEALQRAQLVMLGNEEEGTGKIPQYSHPYYWAPFILLGNWL